MTIGDIFALQVQTSSQGRKTTNNYGYVQTAGATHSLLAQILAKSWISHLFTEWVATQAFDSELQCIYCRRVAPDFGVPFEETVDDGATASPDASAPNDSPFVLRLVTSSPSSKDNGRVYISGYDESDLSFGNLGVGFIAGPLATFIAKLKLPIPSTEGGDQIFSLAVIDRVLDGVKLLPPLANLVTEITNNTFIYAQRLRRTKRTGTAAPLPPP